MWLVFLLLTNQVNSDKSCGIYQRAQPRNEVSNGLTSTTAMAGRAPVRNRSCSWRLPPNTRHKLRFLLGCNIHLQAIKEELNRNGISQQWTFHIHRWQDDAAPMHTCRQPQAQCSALYSVCTTALQDGSHVVFAVLLSNSHLQRCWFFKQKFSEPPHLYLLWALELPPYYQGSSITQQNGQ